MLPVGLEPTITAGERPQTYALDRAATVTGYKHVQIFMNDEPNSFTWDAHLLSYWFGRNPPVFQDQLVNLINNLLRGRAKDLSAPRV
jgi:hypothetical protein